MQPMLVPRAVGGWRYEYPQYVCISTNYLLFMLAEWSLPIEKSPLTFNQLAAYLNRPCANPTVKAVCGIEGMDLAPFKSYS
ncbi:hypothetical protein [Marinomonas spartinae]|uniref:hypothetical protein n=1 Tax=Marinomonas spartinae TaxID=1792290 RepID=UPI0018F241EB|nr:hypothetical protein [Marinomonas spartinae]MBJ7556987.1 hypothetical protein [Marinomonas spartinae]